MSNVTTKQKKEVKVIDKLLFTTEEVALIKSQVAPNATDNELKIFLHQCKRTGLDPLSRQIYCIHRAGKMTIQTSIDGFRTIAERSGMYAGQDEPIFEYDEKKNLVCCKVAVYRFTKNETRYKASVGVAFWKEYAGQNLWIKMPHTMLSKVAEALALRKAFPQELGGIYTTEEMSQADESKAPHTKEVVSEPVNNSEVPYAEEVKANATEMSDTLLQLALRRIMGGDLTVYDKCNTVYALTPEQEEKLLRAHTSAKAKSSNQNKN